MIGNIRLFDTHAHLNDPHFEKDLDSVIERALESGVEHIVIPGCDLESSERALELAHRFDGFLFAAVGLHPHDAKELTPELIESFRELAKDKKVVAIGEIGLDFYRNFSPKDVQIEAFKVQLDLARELNLPVIIHVRKAYPETFQILKEFQGISGVFHCFSGGVEEARYAAKMGFFVSFSGSLTYKSKKLREALKVVPTDKLVFETDSPYLAPSLKRGERNEPSFIIYIVKKAAEILETDIQQLAEQVFSNSLSLFNLEGRTDGNS